MSWPLRQSTQSKYICVPTVRHVPLAERATKMLEMCKSDKKKAQGTAKKQQATPKRPPTDGVYSLKHRKRATHNRKKFCLPAGYSSHLRSSYLNLQVPRMGPRGRAYQTKDCSSSRPLPRQPHRRYHAKALCPWHHCLDYWVSKAWTGVAW